MSISCCLTHTRSRPGYTLVEVFFVMIIAGALMTAAVGSLNKAVGQRSALTARDTYVWLARRARATAVQRGRTVRTILYPATASARLMTGTSGGTQLERVAFERVALTTSNSDSIVVCYTPRGFADTTCSTAGLPLYAIFRAGPRTARANIQALGQVEAVP